MDTEVTAVADSELVNTEAFYERASREARSEALGILQKNRREAGTSIDRMLPLHGSDEHTITVDSIGDEYIDVLEANIDELRKAYPVEITDTKLFIAKVRCLKTVASFFHDVDQEHEVVSVELSNGEGNLKIGERRNRPSVVSEAKSAEKAAAFMHKFNEENGKDGVQFTEKDIEIVKKAVQVTAPSFQPLAATEPPYNVFYSRFVSEFSPEQSESGFVGVYQKALRELSGNSDSMLEKIVLHVVAWGDLNGTVAMRPQQFFQDGMIYMFEDKPHMAKMAVGQETGIDSAELPLVQRELQKYLYFQVMFAAVRREEAVGDLKYLPDGIKEAMLKKCNFDESIGLAYNRAKAAMGQDLKTLLESNLKPVYDHYVSRYAADLTN